MAADAAQASNQLIGYGGLLRGFVPDVDWHRGTTFMRHVTPHPNFYSPHQPKNTVLVTFNDYAKYPGVLLYDFVPNDPGSDYNILSLLALGGMSSFAAEYIANVVMTRNVLVGSVRLANQAKQFDNSRLGIPVKTTIGVGLLVGLGGW